MPNADKKRAIQFSEKDYLRQLNEVGLVIQSADLFERLSAILFMALQ